MQRRRASGGWVGWGAGCVVGWGVCCAGAWGQVDNCAEARNSPLGAWQADTFGRNADGQDGCRPPVSDVWWKFVAPRDVTFVIDTCATNYSIPVFSVHSGCPATPQNMLGCNYNDAYHCGQRPHLEVQCVAGGTYYVRVGGPFSPYYFNAWYEDPRGRSAGPDVVVGDIPDAQVYPDVGGEAVFSYGSTACNVGDAAVAWSTAPGAGHPVVVSALYRVAEGVFEQLGSSWARHVNGAATETFCEVCPEVGVFADLHAGCSESDGAAEAGVQAAMSRRSEVDATRGTFPYPPLADPPIEGGASRRVRVPRARLSGGVTALFAEVQFVSAEDAAAGNGLNNVTSRAVYTGAGPALGTVLLGRASKGRPAIAAWRDADPTVGVFPLDFTDGGIVCRVWVAARVSQARSGEWTYVYAVFNENADRGVAGLVLPRSAGAGVLTQEFRSPAPDPAEVYSARPWVFGSSGGEMGWGSQERFEQDPNGNAVRWGTAYTMVLTSVQAPVTGLARVPLYRPGRAGEATALGVAVPVPGRGACIADFNGDGFVDQFDYLDFVAAFEGGVGSADVDGDDFVDFFDYLGFVDAFGRGC